MVGVEILAASEVVIDKLFNWNSAISAFGITFGFFIICGLLISLGANDWSQMAVGVAIGIVLGAFAAVMFGIGNGIPSEYETQYKVIISDEVFMNDFLERYEILDQEGKIYTVRERDGVEDDN